MKVQPKGGSRLPNSFTITVKGFQDLVISSVTLFQTPLSGGGTWTIPTPKDIRWPVVKGVFNNHSQNTENQMKSILIVALGLMLSSMAQADAVDALFLDENGEVGLDMDEFDPNAPDAESVMDLMEAQGFIERLPEPTNLTPTGPCVAKILVVVDKSENQAAFYANCSTTPYTVQGVTTGQGKTPSWPNGKALANKWGRGRTHESSSYPGGCNLDMDGDGKKERWGNMSYAVYFSSVIAIHGSCAEEGLGIKPGQKGYNGGSHGCIRISRHFIPGFQQEAKDLFNTYGANAVQLITKP